MSLNPSWIRPSLKLLSVSSDRVRDVSDVAPTVSAMSSARSAAEMKTSGCVSPKSIA
jgi:hypothetical protein